MGVLIPGQGDPIWMPDYLQRAAGQFNIFTISDSPDDHVDCKPYSRKGFYKISLLNSHTRLYYADKTLEFKESALLFSNPNIPYSWETLSTDSSGYYCIFTEAFFEERQQIREYPVFKPGNITLFELSPSEVEEISIIFQSMQKEIMSDFQYKYDLIRNLALQLVYKALKMQPAAIESYSDSNGANRVEALFMELLERQFPIESVSQRIELRFPSEYAEHLSIHINYLNRSLKKVTGKTTSQLISARLMQEARILLHQSDWNINEISWCLGFEELPHFINFFKKNEMISPKHYRTIKV